MSDSNDSNFLITNQIRSKAGKTAAANMTPEQRRERAFKASHGRRCYEGIPKASHVGEITFGDIKVSCAVLEDGQRVITQSSMLGVIGKSKGGGKITKKLRELQERGERIPLFVAANNLIPFLSNDLSAGGTPIIFIHPTAGKCIGFKSDLIPEVCDVYLKAREAGVLTKDQMPIAHRAEIIIRSLAKIGITALIDEITGYQNHRENDELQKLFEKFIAKELQPWTKRFPCEYFENIKRIYGLSHLKRSPSFAGHLINRYIYSEISEDVLEELKRKNPVTDSGRRKHAHHQFLTHDVGHPALNKQILKINTLMSASDTKEEFESLFEKTRRK